MDVQKLNVGDFGEEVARLHEKLRKHGLDVSAEEVKRKFFGPATREAVADCQKMHGMDATGEVNEATAAALSIDMPVSRLFPVSGGRPVVPVSPAVPTSPPPQPAPTSAGPTSGGSTESPRVEGRIFFDHGLPAGGVTVRLYSRGFGGAETRLGEIKTDVQGGYVLPYDPGGKAANIEMRVVDTQGKEIQISDTKFNADKSEVLNLVAPTTVQPLAPEFHRLSADLIQQVGDLSRLADARENDERQDLTLLHQATGWDARLLALTTTAVKLGAESGMPHDALYALFRAGLPTDKQQLAWVSSQAVEKALGKAKEAGIVSLDDQQVAATKASFESFARAIRLDTKVPGAVSNFSDMLAKVDLGDDKNKFVDLYFEHRGTARELWEKARTANISEANISKLKFQGKLAYLTLNNADLAVALQQEIGSMDNLSNLVEADLYHADTWKTRLNHMAGNAEALHKLIPPAYVSDQADAKENLQERLDAYSEDLARKVRLSYPTQVVRRMIENGPEKGGLSLGENHEAIKTPVHTFLKNAEGLGFALGQTPVDAFIKQNQQGLFRGIAEDQVVDTTRNVKTLQRLYQTSPSDASLKVLYKEGFIELCINNRYSWCVISRVNQRQRCKTIVTAESLTVCSQIQQVSLQADLTLRQPYGIIHDLHDSQ